ncbi:hypothetical protein K474DRAFT_1673066 [Panus rudis PR-1116 ss-1]|nr:hypothetical protein K474DRAFT_1673066 [Panus rudis PR-1116 ss-1]
MNARGEFEPELTGFLGYRPVSPVGYANTTLPSQSVHRALVIRAWTAREARDRALAESDASTVDSGLGIERAVREFARLMRCDGLRAGPGLVKPELPGTRSEPHPTKGNDGNTKGPFGHSVDLAAAAAIVDDAPSPAASLHVPGVSGGFGVGRQATPPPPTNTASKTGHVHSVSDIAYSYCLVLVAGDLAGVDSTRILWRMEISRNCIPPTYLDGVSVQGVNTSDNDEETQMQKSTYRIHGSSLFTRRLLVFGSLLGSQITDSEVTLYALNLHFDILANAGLLT